MQISRIAAGVFLRQREVMLDSLRAAHEQRHGLVRRQRGEIVTLRRAGKCNGGHKIFELSTQPQPVPAS